LAARQGRSDFWGKIIMRAILAGLTLALTVGAGAQAQQIDDPQANVVEALVVSGKLPGPARRSERESGRPVSRA
jgi:hypothetical protein